MPEEPCQRTYRNRTNLMLDPAFARLLFRQGQRLTSHLALLVTCLACWGCYAPMSSRAIPATALPPEFRVPQRTQGPSLNYSQLTIKPPSDYLLGADDILEVTVPGLFTQSEIHPLRVQVMSNGEVQLPLVGSVAVGGLNLQQAQRAINEAYANGFLNEPRVNVILAQRATVNVLVMGQVAAPGVHSLSKYQNDVGHAVAAAQGFTTDAADYIEVHRRELGQTQLTPEISRLPPRWGDEQLPAPNSAGGLGLDGAPFPHIYRIPLRGPQTQLVQAADVVLQPGDVVVVPSRKHEVFYVVGKLNPTNTVRFTVGDRERELGVGFILPRDREIDVVTAVTMAGYIDPIESPTTVTVHRVMPDGMPFLIKVDLIKARYDPLETVLVQPGDIIYLNPDHNWWMRRTLDRVIGSLITIPYQQLLIR